MFDCPLGSFVMMSVAKTQCIDRLLILFECFLVVITHPQIFFHRTIFPCRNINDMIPSIRQALGNHPRISYICLHPFFLLCQHGCRHKYHTFHPCNRKLIIKRISKTSYLISALNIVFIGHPNFDYSI